MTELWMCGQHRGPESWDFQGIFDSRENAVNACRDYRYFIVPVELNKELPHGEAELTLVPGFEYPKPETPAYA